MGKAERKLLGQLVRPGMTVVDVGANVGLYTILMAGLVGPAGRVISFEPDPDLLLLLRENCAANGAGNVAAQGTALGAAADQMILHRLTINSGENHLGSRDRAAFRRPVEVDVAAFDVLMPGLRPDFIKVDVQGWELNVLRGMEATLRASQAVIYLELWPDGLRRAGSAPADLFSFVKGLGYDFYPYEGGAKLDEKALLSMAEKVKGMNYVNLVATRNGPPSIPCA